MPVIPNACRTCGILLEGADRSYCDDCLPDRKNELITDLTQRSAELRRGHPRPADAGAKQSETMRRRNREIAEWECTHPERVDLDEFRRTILPGLQSVSVRTIARQTGLSSLYASQIRRGPKVPHALGEAHNAGGKRADIALGPLALNQAFTQNDLVPMKSQA
jgi:hypothetical protein